MAAGTVADFKIYDEQYFGGQYERLAQNLNVFNGASQGAITLQSQLVKGEFEKQSFMKMVSGLIAHRDPESLDDVNDTPLTQGEFVGVKVPKRIGPVADTLDKWKRIAQDPEQFSFYVGRMVADQKLESFVNTAILTVAAAISGRGPLNHGPTGDTITHPDLVDAMALLGDHAANIQCWVMHSKPYFDLVKQAITDKIFGVANVAIYQGSVATLGKPTIVIDSPSLAIAGGSGPTTYATLGLQSGAVNIKESELETIEFQRVTGLANLVMRLQGEYSFNIDVRGFKYDVQQGKYPDNTVLGDSGSWVKESTEDKHLAGVRLVTL